MNYHKVNQVTDLTLIIDLTPDLDRKVNGYCGGVRQVSSDLKWAKKGSS